MWSCFLHWNRKYLACQYTRQAKSWIKVLHKLYTIFMEAIGVLDIDIIYCSDWEIVLYNLIKFMQWVKYMTLLLDNCPVLQIHCMNKPIDRLRKHEELYFAVPVVQLFLQVIFMRCCKLLHTWQLCFFLKQHLCLFPFIRAEWGEKYISFLYEMGW